jgi:AraC family transcriptional regulator
MPELLTANHRDDTADAYQKIVERVIRHMKQRLAEPLDLDAIAEIAAISKFHFVRVFDELTGTTPHHFLACLRMQQAKELLLRSDLTITEVCMEVGYASLGSFSKTFSFLVGVSPQQFRAMPKRLDAMQFAATVFRFLASKRKEKGPQIEGIIEGPSRPRGFTFVGAFTRGVPQGVPDSGTVLLTRGKFRVKRPDAREFHLMAVLVPFTAKLTDMVTTLPVGLVASLRIQDFDPERSPKPCLRLRPLRATDPPILLALPSLPPLLKAE